MQMTTNKLVDAAGLAALFKTSERQIYDWHRAGRIPGIRLSRKCLRFHPGDVLRAIKKNKSYESITA
jgi:hypothetical protein